MSKASPAAEQPWWNPITDAVDKARLAGIPTPGICEIIGAGSPRKWDERTGYGWSGAWLVYQGIALSHFSIVLTLYTQSDWDDWDTFRPIVARAPIGTRPKAIGVYHPVLAEVGITSLVVEDVKAPQQIGDGEWIISIDCIEWRQPKFGFAKPDGAEATPNDPVDQEIALKLQERDALANEPP